MGLDLYGIAPTQYRPDGALDPAALAANVEAGAARGIDRVLLTGAYGEFQSLTDDERVAAVGAVVATGACRSVMAGASHPSTDATVALAHRVVEAGADLVMVAPPTLAELGRADVMRHFEALAAAGIGAPLVAYNNPVLGPTLGPADLAELAGMGAYAAVKQGVTRVGEIIEGLHAVRATGAPMKVIAASDLAAVATLAVGLDGLSSTNCWVFPEAYVGLVRAAEASDLARMRALAAALEPYHRAVRALGQPRTVKAAMVQRGWAGTTTVRAPHVALDDGEAEDLAAALETTDRALAALDDGGGSPRNGDENGG